MTPTEQRARRFNVMKQRSHPPRADAQAEHIRTIHEVTERQITSNGRFQLPALDNAIKQTKLMERIASALESATKPKAERAPQAKPTTTSALSLSSAESGDTYQKDDGGLFASGIHLTGHGNAIECYGHTEEAADAVRDFVLDAIHRHNRFKSNDIDLTLAKGDLVYCSGWGNGKEPVEIVDCNWALRAVAVRLTPQSPTAGIVVWPINGLTRAPQ